jgi:hypothetical protein
MIAAETAPIPGISSSRSAAWAKGAIIVSICSSIRSMSASSPSILPSIWASRNRWWSSK